MLTLTVLIGQTCHEVGEVCLISLPLHGGRQLVFHFVSEVKFERHKGSMPDT